MYVDVYLFVLCCAVSRKYNNATSSTFYIFFVSITSCFYQLLKILYFCLIVEYLTAINTFLFSSLLTRFKMNVVYWWKRTTFKFLASSHRSASLSSTCLLQIRRQSDFLREKNNFFSFVIDD